MRKPKPSLGNNLKYYRKLMKKLNQAIKRAKN